MSRTTHWIQHTQNKNKNNYTKSFRRRRRHRRVFAVLVAVVEFESHTHWNQHVKFALLTLLFSHFFSVGLFTFGPVVAGESVPLVILLSSSSSSAMLSTEYISQAPNRINVRMGTCAKVKGIRVQSSHSLFFALAGLARYRSFSLHDTKTRSLFFSTISFLVLVHVVVVFVALK